MTGRNDGRRRPGTGADTGAVQRARRSSQRRLVRTIVLGAVVVAAAIAWLATEFGMDSAELIGYAVSSVLVVLAVVVLAAAGAALLRGLRWLLRRRGR